MSTASQHQDSLDFEQQLYQRSSGGSMQSPQKDSLTGQNLVYKNFYKMQLDELVRQKNEQRRQEKEREVKDRSLYNQRLQQGVQAEKMKDLSYKNYYQMLMHNQNSHSKGYVSPFDERDKLKEKLIHTGVEVEQRRSQMWLEQEQRRNEEMKKSYRELLADQINQKHHKNAVDKEIKTKQQEMYKQITYTPQELAKFERQRRLMEMQRYKDDLDQSSPLSQSKMTGSRLRSQTGPYAKNQFNTQNIEARHDPLVNPVPFNIQNPYILKDMKRNQSFYEPDPMMSRPY